MRFLILFFLAGISNISSGQCPEDNPACESEVTGIARLEVIDKECEVQVTVNSDVLNFGTLQIPGSNVPGEMTLDPVDASPAYVGVTPASGSSPGLGMLIMDAPYCIRCGIRITKIPEVLEHENEPEETIDFALKWASYRDSWSTPVWRNHSGDNVYWFHAVGRDEDDRRRFRFGGTISDITSAAREGEYGGTISVLLECNF